MTRAAYLLLALALPLLVHAQRMSHPVTASRDDAFSSPAVAAAVPDTVHVLAVRVQFQKDTDSRTTGDGQFILAPPATPVIDAPPHDAAYFRNHLLFLQNYYTRASRGKAPVSWTLLDSVVTLPSAMATYSPPKTGSNKPVANLAVDAWRAVDSLGYTADFSRYQCFVVFHAGVGRDIDLASQIGYDPTPLDIPSLYIGLNALQGFYGPNYAGIPVNGGAFHITDTIVIPETESRTIPGAAGDVQLDFGINGLLCASMGNFLGLPDLFNTATGASGIGRFGLMDGQAIFSFNGVFPPEPSAWEKYWLGWITPITLSAGSQTISLPAVAIADSVYRVPISSQEYFLLENRNRNPFGTGVTITSVYNGTTRRQTFAHDTAGFDAFDISALSGVITDVTSLDWSLPGGVDLDATYIDGGILIWHIDEAVISQTIGADAVNANPARKGVNLDEADGSQDIGQSYGITDPGSGSESGTPLDYWYQGNSSPVYKNEFSSATHPNSNSNSGAPSHITIRSFSARGPRMTAVVERGDASVAPLAGFPKSLGLPLTPRALAVGTVSNPALVVATLGRHARDAQTGDTLFSPGKLFAWHPDGTGVFPIQSSDGLASLTSLNEDFFPGPAVADLNGDGTPDCIVGRRDVVGQKGSIEALTLRDTAPVDSLADFLFERENASVITAQAIVSDSLIAFGDANGMVRVLRFNGAPVDSFQTFGSPTPSPVTGVSLYRTPGEFIATNADGTLSIHSPGSGTQHNFGRRIVGPAVAGRFGSDVYIAFATADGYLYLVDNSFTPRPGFPVNTGDSIAAPPALADIDGDGVRDIVVLSGSKICVYNANGVPVDNFPVTIRSGEPLASNPIVADMDGDGTADIVAVSRDGVVAAVDRNGKMVRGFPLNAGLGEQTAAAFLMPAGATSTIALAVASGSDGSVTGWRTGSTTSWMQPWPQYQKDAARSGLDLTSISRTAAAPAGFFPAERAYNWPNPVVNGTTHIRYYVQSDATVRVRIFDMAGDLVADFKGPGVGGIDNEVEWNVGGVQSGIYFAHVEAKGATGSGVAIIKVAVVK